MIALFAVSALPGGIAQAATLVSNIGQSTATNLASVSSAQSQAQAFTTGSLGGGYDLESVEVRFANFTGTTSHISVSIYSEASGDPNSQVYALSNPATITGGTREFRAPAGATLDASTTYFVVISTSSSTIAIRRTASDNEDTGGATGWSIANDRRFGSGTNWSATADALKIRVKDATVDNTPPAVSQAQVASLVATQVQLEFDEALVSTSIPAASQFTVKVEGNSRTPTFAQYNALTRYIILTLAATDAIRPGETVTVSYTKPGTNPLKDAAGNQTASFTDQAVTNNLPAIKPDAPTNLHAKGVSTTQIDLSWSAPEYTGGAAITGYRIEVSNDGNTFTNLVADTGSTSRTYSHTGLNSGDTRYYRVSAINSAGTSPESNVASASAMDTAPGVTGAEIRQSGRAVRLLFDEAPVSTSTPAASAFTLKVEGNARTPASAFIITSPNGISLQFAAADLVKPGETVTVSYTKPGTNPLKDAAGTETASFTDFPVVNNLAPITPDAPTNLRAKGVSATQIGLSWSAPEYTGGTAITGYRIEVSNDGNTGWTQLVASQTSRTYSHTVTSGATRYYGVSAINSAGTSVASSVASASAMDTAPGVTGAEIRQSGRSVRLLFDEAPVSTSTPAASAFTLKVEGNARTPASAFIITSPNGISLQFAAADLVKPGETVTVSYTKPGTNPLQDAAGTETASFTDYPVDNYLTATAPEAPGNLAASPGSDTGTTALTWVTPWANGSDIAKFQVRYIAGTTAGGTWADIDGSNASTTTHTVTGLTAGAQYTFGVRAVNGIGNGAEETVTATVMTVTWEFTLTRNGSAVTQLTEGGPSATAEVRITNSARFSTAQTVTLEWGNIDITSGRLIQGAGGVTVITIPANGASGSLVISAPQGPSPIYSPELTAALTATHGGSEIGSINVTFVDDEARPVLTISAPDTVTEGDDIPIELNLTTAFRPSFGARHTVTDADNALSAPPAEFLDFCRRRDAHHNHVHRRQQQRTERWGKNRDLRAAAEPGRPLHPRHPVHGDGDGAGRRHAAAGAGESQGRRRATPRRASRGRRRCRPRRTTASRCFATSTS